MRDEKTKYYVIKEKAVPDVLLKVIEAKRLMDEHPEAVILDVRESDEFDAGHIPGAKLLPVGSVNEDTAAAVIPKKDSLVLVYCRSGRRSKLAAEALAGLGYSKVMEFGGIIDWPYDIE